MKFPIHDFPNDFWRYTPEGFRSLLKQFHSFKVYNAGRKNFPHTIFAIGFKGISSKTQVNNFNTEFNKFLKYYENMENEKTKIKYKKLKLFIPPIFLKIYEKLVSKFKN